MIPQLPDGAQPLLRVSTPLTMLGVFIEILRNRYKEGSSIDPILPWVWSSEQATTGLFIENGWNENIEARNVRPGIWIDREQNVYGKVSIGDQDQMPVYPQVRLESFYTIGEMDILIDCTAPKRGESMVIGSVTQDYLHMTSNYIQALFGLRSMTPVMLDRTVPFEKDTKLWTSPVRFRAEYEVRWATMPIANALNEISATVRDVENPETFFLDIALRSATPPD